MHHERFSRSLVTVLAMLLLLPALAFAQKDTGTIIGNVSDEHGTPLAGAKVTLIVEKSKQAKDQITDASTDGTGEFRFDNVKPGR